MSKPLTPDPILDPYAAMMLTKPKKSTDLAEVAKITGSADERGRLEDIRNAAVRHQAHLAEFDSIVKPCLDKLLPFLGRNQKFVWLMTENERLVSLWLGKWIPLGRVGVNEDGQWTVTNDRDEVENVANGTQAIAKLLEYLAPTFKENEKAKTYEANHNAMQENQDLQNKEVRRRMKEEDGYSPAFTTEQLAAHDARLKAKA